MTSLFWLEILIYILQCLLAEYLTLGGEICKLNSSPVPFTTKICQKDFFADPLCIDEPNGYNCECGDGFRWNTQRCIAVAVDSCLVFKAKEPLAYAILLDHTKIVPDLHSFTFVGWIKLSHIKDTYTIVSYQHLEASSKIFYRRNAVGVRDWMNVQVLTSGDFKFQIFSEEHAVVHKLHLGVEPNTWFHLAWTISSRNVHSVWCIYLNGKLVKKYDRLKLTMLPKRGELVLGQSSRFENNSFDSRLAFVGELSHIHMWNKTLNRSEVLAVIQDWSHMLCGDVVEWSHFRFGTRGNVSLKWPSGVYSTTNTSCVTDQLLQMTCDRACSQSQGAQCKAEVNGNIRWPRTKTSIDGIERVVPCPGISNSINESISAEAVRKCFLNEEKQADWGIANVSQCISKSHLILNQQLIKLESLHQQCQLTIAQLIEHLELTDKLSQNGSNNPIDIHEIIAQISTTVRLKRTRADSCNHAQLLDRSTYNSTRHLLLLVLNITSHLMDQTYRMAWNATRPAGAEAAHLMRSLHALFADVTRDFYTVVKGGILASHEVKQYIQLPNLIFKQRITRWKDFTGEAFPDIVDLQMPSESVDPRANTLQKQLSNMGVVTVDRNIIEKPNFSNSLQPQDYISTVSVLYSNLGDVLPNVLASEERFSYSLKELQLKKNKLNSAVFYMHLYHNGEEIALDYKRSAVRTKLYFSDNQNISYPKCVRSAFNETFTHNTLYWNRDGCTMEIVTNNYAICRCRVMGLYALTTDMFNDNWNRKQKDNPLLEAPSYFGCGCSALFCFISFVMLTYLRCNSNTASLHKNFALSIVGGQIFFMFGVDKFEDNKLLCHSMACLLHYFYMASFSWLMNEAFNLYIVITYAAHSHTGGDHTEGGMWRYYLLGWIMPGILVGAFVGANGEGYYATDMCWIAWKHVWIFIGPAISLIAITVMVLTFTAKEHHESSYTKNEKDNKAIVLHTKAIWTQVILLSLAWSFAFVSVKMHGIIIKYLFAMFNCLQGIFFIVFYFLLNGEVQNMHSDSQKRRTLALQGIDKNEEKSQSMHSLCSTSSVECSLNKSQDEKQPGEKRSTKLQHIFKSQTHNRRSHRSRTSSSRSRSRGGDTNLQPPMTVTAPDSAEETSDCEMIVTSV